MWVASRSVCLLFILVVCHILYSLYCLHSEGVGGGDNLWFQLIDPLCNHCIAPGMSMSIILPPGLVNMLPWQPPNGAMATRH